MEVDKTDMMENTADSPNMQKTCHDVRSLQSDVSTNHMIITFGTVIHSVNVQLMKRNITQNSVVQTANTVCNRNINGS